MGQLTIKQILQTLETQLLYGKSYLGIARGLRDAEPIVTGFAYTFFGLMQDSGFFMAQMCLARLYDKRKGTVKIPLLLDEASKHPEAFQHSKLVAEAVRVAQAKVTSLAPVLSKIKHRRDTWFAHVDLDAVHNPLGHQAKAELTIDQLQDAFSKTESILKEFGYLLDNTVGAIKFLGADDYKHLFELIRKEHADEVASLDRKFEKQFGHAPPKRK